METRGDNFNNELDQLDHSVTHIFEMCCAEICEVAELVYKAMICFHGSDPKRD